jgi:hypothetical protein
MGTRAGTDWTDSTERQCTGTSTGTVLPLPVVQNLVLGQFYAYGLLQFNYYRNYWYKYYYWYERYLNIFPLLGSKSDNIS